MNTNSPASLSIAASNGSAPARGSSAQAPATGRRSGQLVRFGAGFDAGVATPGEQVHLVLAAERRVEGARSRFGYSSSANSPGVPSARL